MTSPDRRVVILGAGVGGLSAGWALTRLGYHVTILEKTAEAGGLAVTRARDGFRYDLGPHNIHTRHRYVLTFLRRTFHDLFQHDLESRVFKRGVFVRYPLTGAQVITSLPLWRVGPAVVSFVAARLQMFFGDPPEDGSFERWITNRFGRVLFREYFHDYPRKVWQAAPRDIDRLVGERRVPVVGLTEMIRAALLGRRARTGHPEFDTDNFYLPHGIGAIPEFLRRECEERGGRLLYQVTPAGLSVDDGQVRAVAYRDAAGRLETMTCDYVLSTIPLHDLLALLPSVTTTVREAASRLRYLAMVLVYLEMGRRDVLPSHIVYFTDTGTPFSRVTDFGRFSRDMTPDGRTLLCLELPCAVGDEYWQAPEDRLRDLAVSALQARGLVAGAEVDGVFVERLTHAYPQFTRGFGRDVRTCLGAIDRLTNVVSYGRQGGFAYVNTDSVIHMGLQAADAVVVARSLGYSCAAWFEAQVRDRTSSAC